MTDNDLNDNEQRAAMSIAENTIQVLMRTGYDFALVSIVKCVPTTVGTVLAPGTTLFEANPRALPCFPNLARNLRAMAAQLDAAFEASGVPEAPESYSHMLDSVSGGQKYGGDR